MNLRAFHGDEAIKAKYLARVHQHRLADELVQGTGWSTKGPTRGCAVGCTLDAYDHSRYPIELGIPEELARLEDQLFETLPVVDAMAWPERFLSVIPVGADLAKVWPRWAVWMLLDLEHGVIRHADGHADVHAAITNVAMLWQRIANGEPVSIAEFKAAARAARAAARAARAAAGAAWAAAGAARAEAAVGAEAAAWAKAASDKLIELLSEVAS